MREVFDHIVVGAGASGSVVAARLAAAGGAVLLLEAGGTHRRLDIIVPGAVASAYRTANWKYPVEPDPTRTNSASWLKAGKVLGGGGSINSCVFVRGSRNDFDEWARLGAHGWSYNDVLPAFKKMETWEGGSTEYRGGDGPINVVVQTDHGVANRAFFEAAQQAGHAPNDDYNSAVQDGVSFVQVNHRRGRRSQSSTEYLKRVAPRHRLIVRTESLATKVLCAGDQAIGVEYRRAGTTHRAYTRAEVVLSAGAIGTPKLLKLSGVGPRIELEDLGIAVVSHVPGVGANLHDHGLTMQTWRAKKAVPTLNNMGPMGALKGVAEYLIRGTGFLAMTVVPMQVLAKSHPSEASPDLQLCFAPFAITKGKYDVQLDKVSGFFASSVALHPRARGTVTLRSASPLDAPVIDYHFFRQGEDLRVTLAGVQQMQRVMAQPAMTSLTDGLMGMAEKCSTNDDWVQYARMMTTSAAHPVGSCRMGSDDMAVVDSSLRVRGMRNLRVVDASIMPRITSGNTYAPSVMIGERAAELMLGGHTSPGHSTSIAPSASDRDVSPAMPSPREKLPI